MPIASRQTFDTLDRLPCGRTAIIVRLNGEPSRIIRLMELGLMEGEAVEMLGCAPFGDPLAVRIRGCRLALRRHEAALIEIDVSVS